MVKPIAVLISDVHFNISTLKLASYSLVSALNSAENLKIPLIIAGDLHDNKAIIRAEVANELIKILSGARTPVYIMVGNHDLINERGTDHGLNYLEPYSTLVSEPKILWISEDPRQFINLIPYTSNSDILKEYLGKIGKGSILIMHQGFLGAQMGDYVLDKTSISPDLVKDFTVISGHYHRHQTIQTVTYIGSPYTITFGEANDGPKGYLTLNSDGSYTRNILYLPKHVIINAQQIGDKLLGADVSKTDINDKIWLKVSGKKSDLDKINKNDLGTKLFDKTDYRLDLIPTESLENPTKNISNFSAEVIFDNIINNLEESEDQKKTLMSTWRDMYEIKKS